MVSRLPLWVTSFVLYLLFLSHFVLVIFDLTPPVLFSELSRVTRRGCVWAGTYICNSHLDAQALAQDQPHRGPLHA